MRSTITLVTMLATLAGASAAQATSAPGVVATPFAGEPSKLPGVDPFAVLTSAPLPDGGIVTAGNSAGRLGLARFRADGSLDPAFGKGGTARLTVTKDLGYVGPFPSRILPMADGRLVVVTQGPAASRFESNRAVVTRVLADGRLDASFGSSGSVVTEIQGRTASLQADGKIVVTGSTGAAPRPLENGFTGGSLAWTAIRLDPVGALDKSFGVDGTVTLNLAGAGGLDSAPIPGGRTAVTGTHAGNVVMLALRPDGIVDPGFNGGAPLPLAGPAELLPRTDGSLDVASGFFHTRSATVRHVRADGTFDPAFGTDGTATVPYGELSGGVVRAPDGSLVAYAVLRGNGAFHDLVRVMRLSADGKPDPAWGGADGTVLSPAFGGGHATVGAVHEVPRVEPLRGQSGFSTAGVSARPDGGLLVAGTVSVIQYTGEGEGFLRGDVGVAAFRPDLTPDLTWGGPMTPARLSISVPPQRARTVAQPKRPRAIRIVASTSGPGLVRISVRARGRTVALASAPAYRSGKGQVLDAYLTLAGRRILARTRVPVPMTVSATFRDFVRSEARASARGRLR